MKPVQVEDIIEADGVTAVVVVVVLLLGDAQGANLFGMIHPSQAEDDVNCDVSILSIWYSVLLYVSVSQVQDADGVCMTVYDILISILVRTHISYGLVQD